MADRGRALALHHAGVTVADMEQSLLFYQGVLELEIVSDAMIKESFAFEIAGVTGEAMRIVCLAIPGASNCSVELLEYVGVERRPGNARPWDCGSGHLCLEVVEIDELHRRLVDAGYEAQSKEPVRVPPNAGGATHVLYAKDPDGYWVELLQRAS